MCCILIVGLILCLFSGPLFAAPGTFYKDVKIGNWYYEPVKYATEHKLMNGMGDRIFAPHHDLTRAMFVQVIYNLDGSPSVNNDTATFSDVDSGQWYAKAVNWAAANDIVHGYNDGTFGPQNLITRQEMAKIIDSYLLMKKYVLPESDTSSAPFTDFYDCGSWARDSIRLMQKIGIFTGYDDDTFRPQKTAIRSEAATVFAKLYSLIYNDSVEFKAPPSTSLSLVKYIYHAGGIVNDDMITNSLEALNQTYFSGGRFIELDFNWTSDHQLVCVHEFSTRFSPIFAGGAVSLSEFMQVKIKEKYTPLDLAALKDWMEDHPDVYIVTDVKSDNIKALKKIENDYPEMTDRVIPQIYDIDEYSTVSALGYENIILTLYLNGWEEKYKPENIVSSVAGKSFWAITFPESMANAGYVNALKGAGCFLFTHTINDPALAEQYLSLGMKGIYTDSLY